MHPARNGPPFPDDRPYELVEGQGQKSEIRSAHADQERSENKGQERGRHRSEENSAHEGQPRYMQPAQHRRVRPDAEIDGMAEGKHAPFVEHHLPGHGEKGQDDDLRKHAQLKFGGDKRNKDRDQERADSDGYFFPVHSFPLSFLSE